MATPGNAPTGTYRFATGDETAAAARAAPGAALQAGTGRHLHAVAGIGSHGFEWAPLDTGLIARAPRVVRCHARVVFAASVGDAGVSNQRSCKVRSSDRIAVQRKPPCLRSPGAIAPRGLAGSHGCARLTVIDRSLRDGPASGQHLLEGHALAAEPGTPSARVTSRRCRQDHTTNMGLTHASADRHQHRLRKACAWRDQVCRAGVCLLCFAGSAACTGTTKLASCRTSLES